MRYLEGSFSVGAGTTQSYRDNWRRTFGPPAKYEELLHELVLMRRSGQLSREQEIEMAGEMNRYWNEMTDEEQAEMERINAAISD